MLQMRQSTLDREDQLKSLVDYGIPNAFQALYELDKVFNRQQEEYHLKRSKALAYIKELNSFEDKLHKSL